MPNHTQIVYYDFASVAFVGYYLEGFLQQQQRYGYHLSVARNVPPIFDAMEIDEPRRETLYYIGLFKVRSAGEEYYFCIDTRDQSTNESPQGFHLPLLNEVRYYFKVNYDATAIYEDPILSRYQEKILPISPFIPIRLSKPWIFWPRAWPSKATRWTYQKAKRRLRELVEPPTLQQYRALRLIDQELDVFFVTAFYHQPHHAQVAEFRYELARELNRRSDLNCIAGIVGEAELPKVYQDLRIERMALATYLNQLARSKVAVYVRGPHRCISYKFGQLLAMGKPIVGQRLHCNQDFLYGMNNFDEQFAYEDPREIVDRIADLIRQPDKLSQLSQSNAEVFDTVLAPEMAVARVLQLLMQRTLPDDEVIENNARG